MKPLKMVVTVIDGPGGVDGRTRFCLSIERVPFIEYVDDLCRYGFFPPKRDDQKYVWYPPHAIMKVEEVE